MSRPDAAVDSQRFREAMARFASGVTVVTTIDEDAKVPVGFTASAFSSLSLDPPLVLVCLARSADCYPAFATAGSMAVSILRVDQQDVALRFATRGADKFGPTALVHGEVTGLPLIRDALAHVECELWDRFDGGDHVILVGKVLLARVADGEPLLHFNRRFGRFLPLEE